MEVKVKTVTELKEGDVLKKKGTDELLTIHSFIDDIEQGRNFYFKYTGYVRSKGMKNFFESNEKGSLIFN